MSSYTFKRSVCNCDLCLFCVGLIKQKYIMKLCETISEYQVKEKLITLSKYHYKSEIKKLFTNQHIINFN